MNWITGDTKIEVRYLDIDNEVLYKTSEWDKVSDALIKIKLSGQYGHWVCVISDDGTQWVKAFGTKRTPMGEMFNEVSVRLCLKRINENRINT